MKSSLIVVEGQTEQVFLEKLFQTIAQSYNYRITKTQKVGRHISVLQEQSPQGADYLIEILDVGGHESVGSYINDNIDEINSRQFDYVFGLRDLYTGDKRRIPLDIAKIEALYKQKSIEWGLNVDIVVAVNEVETWFLADPQFFLTFDSSLTNETLTSILGYDLLLIDLETIPHPAAAINKVLKHISYPGGYSKDLDIAHRITSNINLDDLYLTFSKKLQSLGKLVTAVDLTLTEF